MREFAAYLQSFNDQVDTSKFQFTDRVINGTDLRVSYEVWFDIADNQHLVDPATMERSKDYIQAMLDQSNIRKADTSKQLGTEFMAWQVPKQIGRPDVLLFNAANAHALFSQRSSLFRKWIRDLSDLTVDVVAQQGQKGVPKLFWYGNPFIRGCARPGTKHLTQARNVLFNEIAL